MGADLHLEEVLQPVVGNVVDVCVHLAVVKPFSICQTCLKNIGAGLDNCWWTQPQTKNLQYLKNGWYNKKQ